MTTEATRSRRGTPAHAPRAGHRHQYQGSPLAPERGNHRSPERPGDRPPPPLPPPPDGPHLATCPATVWKYVESAATRSAANLVMLDLEDSIPRGDDAKLAQGRANVVHSFNTLDWGSRLRFFRPRGLALDPKHEDIAVVVAAAGKNLDGLIFPKTETPDEVRSIDATLSALERKYGLEEWGRDQHPGPHRGKRQRRRAGVRRSPGRRAV